LRFRETDETDETAETDETLKPPPVSRSFTPVSSFLAS